MYKLSLTGILVGDGQGDFNEILSEDEKLGGAQKPRGQLESFQDALDDCGLQDLGYTGPPFTWCNKRNGEEMVQERFDRCVGNFPWISLLRGASVKHFKFWRSDHRPIILDVRLEERGTGSDSQISARRFHFEECWADRDGCASIIARSFQNSSSMYLRTSKKGLGRIFVGWRGSWTSFWIKRRPIGDRGQGNYG
ncbi:hypothetical protein Dsin_008903 [Dipteronia sinensis]|uniref:Uncharacterized protein n=1 Tax=Dipteronia sinensis TaxID=43782 RepID=A0AAE0APK9_9ROSI|nr:hypothetical protein Dsin_008903 [Dipteronia sinensis]